MPRLVPLIAGIALGLAALGADTGPAHAQICLPSPCPPTPPPESPPSSGTALPVGPPAEATGSVTDRVDMGNTGFLASTQLVPPLVPRWSRLLPGPVSATLVSDNLAVVLSGSRLFGLSLASGRMRWSRRALGPFAVLAGDRLISAGERGTQAVDAATGTLIWQQAAATAIHPPLVAGGVVYARAALRLSDGQVLANQNAEGDALAGRWLFESDPCSTLARDRGSLGVAWSSRVGCSTGQEGWVASDGVEVVHLEGSSTSDRVVRREAASGTVRGSYGGIRPWPAVLTAGLIVIGDGDSIGARRRSDGGVAWRVRVRDDQSRYSFYGKWEVPPLGVGGVVYRITARGVLSALDLRTGRSRWRSKPRAQLEGYDSGGVTSGPMGAGQNVLLVPGGRRLTAYENAFNPGPGGVDAGPAFADIYFDQHVRIAGLLGTGLRRARPRVTLVATRGRSRRYKRVDSTLPAPDGYFGFQRRMPRNTRFRVEAAGARSRAFTVYAYPRIHLAVRLVSREIARAAVRVRYPPRARLAGRRFVLYIQRGSSRLLKRLGGGRLHGRRGRARTSFSFRAPRRLRSRDYFVFCVKGQARAGLGPPGDPVFRRCGARRIRT